ncbi:MAG TPA: hypothetical protein VNG71_14920 [Pyrinomonadaceae bacterium]|nr:hypothetical protein [Pyrinomonadaceae bacterium]
MQRLRDSEGRHVLNSINGEKAPPPNEVQSALTTENETLGEIAKETEPQNLEVYEDF